MKHDKNEELQSRRQFFKKAAKGALPILGASIHRDIGMHRHMHWGVLWVLQGLQHDMHWDLLAGMHRM